MCSGWVRGFGVSVCARARLRSVCARVLAYARACAREESTAWARGPGETLLTLAQQLASVFIPLPPPPVYGSLRVYSSR